MVPLEAVLTQSQMQKTKQKKNYKSVINTEKSQIYEESIVLAPRNTSHQNTAGTLPAPTRSDLQVCSFSVPQRNWRFWSFHSTLTTPYHNGHFKHVTYSILLKFNYNCKYLCWGGGAGRDLIYTEVPGTMWAKQLQGTFRLRQGRQKKGHITITSFLGNISNSFCSNLL